MRYATMGNMSSRGSCQDGDQNPFFFEQTSYRRAPKRYKKTPDELPDELKYAHLGPRVAAFLATKDRDKIEESQEFNDGLGNKSLLPQINKKVSLLRNSLDSLLSSRDDQNRLLFHESKTNAPTLLVQLAKVLYLWEGLHPSLPRSLHFYLSCKYKEFVGEIEVHGREWQLLSSKEEYLAKILAIEAAQKEEGRISVLSNARSSEDLEMEKTGRDNLIGKDSEGRLSRSKSKVMSRASTLVDITESEEGKRKDLSRPASRQDMMQRSASKKDIFKGETPKVKTRLEKYRSGMHLDSKAGPDSRRGRTTDSVLGESFAENSRLLGGGAKDAGYWAIINFQLSSKLCEDMGWIIHPNSKEDPERETLLEWATQKLQVAIKQKKEQVEDATTNGLDRPVVFRYYGDSRKEMVDRYKTTRASSAYSSRNKPVSKGEKPSIPAVDIGQTKDKHTFLTTTSDGSTTIFYPSGLPAIVTCRSVGGSTKSPPSYYYIVYSNSCPQRMLAIFTPWGHCCAYHDNDKIRFLADKEGGTLADTDGNIQRRWTWPNWTQKLPVTIVFQLNASITLRCMNLNQIQLYFNHNKESYKLNIGVTNLTEEPPAREDMGHLITGLNFQSKTARDFAKPYRAKSNIKSKGKGPRSKLAFMVGLHGKSQSSVNGTVTQNSSEKKSLGSASPLVRLRPLSKCVITLPKARDRPQWELVKPIKSLDTNVPTKELPKSEKSKKWSRLLNNKDHTEVPEQILANEGDKDDDCSRFSLAEVVKDQFQKYSKDLLGSMTAVKKKNKSGKVKLPPISKAIGGTLKVYQKTSGPKATVANSVKKAGSGLEVDTGVTVTFSSAQREKQVAGQQLLPVSVSNPEGSGFGDGKLRIGPGRGKISFLLDRQVSARSGGSAQHGLMHGNHTVTGMQSKAAAKAELEKLLEFHEPTKNDPEADKELSRLQNKVQIIVEDWLEHYRMAVGIKSPYLQGVQDKPVVKKTRNVRSAVAGGGGVVVIEREATTVPRPSLTVRAPSAPAGRSAARPVTGSSVRSDRGPDLKESVVKFNDNPQEIEPDTYSLGKSMTIGRDSSLGSASSCHSGRVHSAPLCQRSQSTISDLSPTVGMCPVAVRMILLGHSHVICRCSRHKIPYITDVEFDTFIRRQAPEKQLIVIAVTSTRPGWINPIESMLEQLHDEKNRNRTRPCMQSRNDPFRVFWYDVSTAAELSDHSQPLLLRRHNVVPGMFLIYETGKLLFCDQIFNGYGSARKDFHKQLIGSRQAAILGKVLPPDFKFSPQKGRPGQRAAWGGDMGILLQPKTQSGDPTRRGSNSSFSSGDSKDLPIDNELSGAGFSMNRVISRSLTEAAIWDRQSPRPSAGYGLLSKSYADSSQHSLTDFTSQPQPDDASSHPVAPPPQSDINRTSNTISAMFTHLPEIKSSA